MKVQYDEKKTVVATSQAGWKDFRKRIKKSADAHPLRLNKSTPRVMKMPQGGRRAILVPSRPVAKPTIDALECLLSEVNASAGTRPSPLNQNSPLEEGGHASAP